MDPSAFFNYNLPDGWYLMTSPIITANVMAESSQQWTVPLGGSMGKIIRRRKRKKPWDQTAV